MPTLLRAVIEATGLSRRKAFAAIREGHVSVDQLSVLDPSSDFTGGALSLDGEALATGQRAKVYLLLNKPPGYVTTLSDERGRRTVLDLVPAGLRASGLHPVGRLDLGTSGLLLLTNDGDLTHALTHPSHEVEKEYWLRLAAPASDELLAHVRRGVLLDGQMRRPVRLQRLLHAGQFELSITLREGRRRQVRRMLEALGARVSLLRRVREGSLELGSLPEGAVRSLTEPEIESLKWGSVPSRLTGPLTFRSPRTF